jgi:hypothetical protein
MKNTEKRTPAESASLKKVEAEKNAAKFLSSAERERANLAKLPEMCFVDVVTEDVLCIVKRGESGYYRTDWPKSKDRLINRQVVAERNEGLGVTPAKASAMSNGSMFGWHTVGADADHEVNQR